MTAVIQVMKECRRDSSSVISTRKLKIETKMYYYFTFSFWHRKNTNDKKKDKNSFRAPIAPPKRESSSRNTTSPTTSSSRCLAGEKRKWEVSGGKGKASDEYVSQFRKTDDERKEEGRKGD